MKKTLIILLILGVSLSAKAMGDLCDECKNIVVSTVIGKCVECGQNTSSSAYQLCNECSKKLGECQLCRVPFEKLDETFAGKEVKITLEKCVRIQVAGNITTGYKWDVAKIDGTSVKQIGELKYIPKQATEGMVGTGGFFFVDFKAIEPGKTIVTLEYKRPWEKDKEPEKLLRFIFVVEK